MCRLVQGRCRRRRCESGRRSCPECPPCPLFLGVWPDRELFRVVSDSPSEFLGRFAGGHSCGQAVTLAEFLGQVKGSLIAAHRITPRQGAYLGACRCFT